MEFSVEKCQSLVRMLNIGGPLLLAFCLWTITQKLFKYLNNPGLQDKAV